MKIGFNGLFFQFPATGSGQYMIHLLSALGEISPDNDYLLFGPQAVKIPPQVQQFPYQVHPVPTADRNRANIEKVVWEQVTGPAAAHKARVDLYHVPYFAPPLVPRNPTVVTIHDVIPLRLPAYHPAGRVKTYMQMVARASQNATMIITISQHAKRDIIELLHLPEERIRVIYQAASEEFKPVHDPAKLAEARMRYGLNERYIFYLGGLDQRKNVQQLVRAFAHVHRQVGDPQLQLLIAGNPDKQKGSLFPDPRPVAADLGMSGQIIYRFVEEEDKTALYSGTSLFVFPSLYEGFGLPPLEAMASGVPVVVSDRTALPEVCGTAAVYADPDDPASIASGIDRLLGDKSFYEEKKESGLKRASQFTWTNTALAFRESIHNAMKGY